jgi:hypothetical protein
MTDMSDDELRARLSRLDPAPAGTPVDPATSLRARSLMERAMTTPVQTPTPSVPDELARRRRPWLLAVAAAAVLVALVSGAFLLGGGGGDGGGAGAGPAPLALELPPADAAMSCIMFDVALLAEMPVAFGGTVTAIEDGQVAVDVDRWYRGGEAERVTIAVPGQQTSAALDGVDFRTGERYLITATDGTVNGCGFSGPATPELESAFGEAFGG